MPHAFPPSSPDARPTPRSLCFATDLMVLGEDATHTALPGGAWAVRCPAEPGYWWGNFLLFPEAPTQADLQAWPAAFAQHFGQHPEVRHEAYGWDDPTGALGATEAFLAAGYLLQPGVVLVAEAAQVPPPAPDGSVVRALLSDADWAQAAENQIACRGEGHDPAPYRAFKVAQMACHRRAVAQGRALWFGAFVGDALVADCGVYVNPEGLARFQAVGTAPGHRRQGHAGRLIAGATRLAAKALGAKRLVIVTDEEGAARRVYEALGYREVEKAVGFVKPAP